MNRHPVARNRLLLYPQQRTFQGPRWTSGYDPKATLGLSEGRRVDMYRPSFVVGHILEKFVARNWSKHPDLVYSHAIAVLRPGDIARDYWCSRKVGERLERVHAD